MLTDRQLLILQSIIQLYTETLEPVGSKKLMQQTGLAVSSATIRNEMMKLEEMGYLEKNHSSSGRVPSNQGYRYYLDNILPVQNSPVSLSIRNQIRETFQQSTMEIQDVFKVSADIFVDTDKITQQFPSDPSKECYIIRISTCSTRAKPSDGDFSHEQWFS